MKIGTPISKARPSRRPQLWISDDKFSTRVRIIYPTGRVEYIFCDFTVAQSDVQIRKPYFKPGCTSSDSMAEALKKCLTYDRTVCDFCPPAPLSTFAGYL